MKRSGLILAVVLLCLLLAGLNAFADEIKVGGGGAAMSSMFKPVQLHFEKATGIYLVNLQSTPKNGLIDLVNGKVDAATAAVPLESMIEGAKKDGVQVDAASLQQTVVGTNKTVVFVHKDNPVAKLTKEQLKGIFTGKINNWKEVGGSDKDIIVVWGQKTPGQNGLFIKQVLDGETVIKEVLDATDYADILSKISVTPEGIGIDPLGMADSAVRIVDSPEITSPIILVSKGKPSPNLQKLIEFVKGDGKKYTKQ